MCVCACVERVGFCVCMFVVCASGFVRMRVCLVDRERDRERQRETERQREREREREKNTQKQIEGEAAAGTARVSQAA